MKILIILFLLMFFVNTSYAYRVQKPFPITDFDQNNLVTLNEALENLWNITNGRYTLDVITTDPNGNRKGFKGDMVILDTGSDQYFFYNTDGATNWQQLPDTSGGLWETDISGNLMPITGITATDTLWELDGSGNLQPLT